MPTRLTWAAAGILAATATAAAVAAAAAAGFSRTRVHNAPRPAPPTK